MRSASFATLRRNVKITIVEASNKACAAKCNH
jgi:hypothetical protein